MNKITLSILFVITPSISYASGGDILSLLWLNVTHLLIIFISLFVAKFPAKQKLVVFVTYLVALIVAFISTSNMPYSDNIYLINTVDTAIPFFAWLAVYTYYYKKLNKSLKQIGAKDAPPG